MKKEREEREKIENDLKELEDSLKIKQSELDSALKVISAYSQWNRCVIDVCLSGSSGAEGVSTGTRAEALRSGGGSP